MSGQMKSFQKKQKTIDDYLSEHDIYGEFDPVLFDMRGYSAYIEQNNLKSSDITEEIMRRFDSDAIPMIKT